ncbi:hypothetical protein H6F74_15625 [Trichocoleus sp. FACHB-90]|nr:hypothetical protein [Trichocoleus sp. FACHB-90]MBD1927662.1 hypothetical protein [Trichocoleus sp. FACHB-90]
MASIILYGLGWTNGLGITIIFALTRSRFFARRGVDRGTGSLSFRNFA